MAATLNFDARDLQRLRADPDVLYKQTSETNYVRSSPNIIFLPCNLQFIRNRRGYLSLGFIVFTWAYGTYFVPKIVLIPQYTDGNVGIVSVLCYYIISILTFVSLFRAATCNPGHLPFDLKATTLDQLNWTHCQRCLIQRPLKSHHCSKCQRCVRKMDHHCHWINNCVAEDNQWLFFLLVLYATLLSVYTLILDTLHFYYFPVCASCQTNSFLFNNQRYFMYLSFILGIILTWLAGGQVLAQSVNILSSRTTIETIIESHKPIHERSPPAPWSPYQRFRDVCGPGWMLCWLNPFRRHAIKPEIFYYQQSV